MLNKHLALAAIAALAFATGAHAQAPDFKGIALGADLEAVKTALPKLSCRDTSAENRPLADTICEPYQTGDTIAGVPVLFLMISLYDKRVASIHVRFPESAFDRVSEALIEKFGQPKSDKTETIQNRGGAKFENRTLAWDDVKVTQRAGK